MGEGTTKGSELRALSCALIEHVITHTNLPTHAHAHALARAFLRVRVVYVV